MKTYVCGGAVRDMLMGVEPKDIDYVVVGSTHDEMLAKGFIHVSARDFPVYHHPETGHEYALARRERKVGSGYLAFETEYGTDVSLEEDLGRRDLTINSIAYDPEADVIIDPFCGQLDIESKILWHTSNAFVEDPVRVLRVARLRARFGPDWIVADETKDLIHTMAKKGVLSELQPDRVWKELSRALMEDHPRLFFDTLLECDALHVLFPEIYRLLSALESHRWHPEGNAYCHTMLVLTQAASFSGSSLEQRMAALVHDFGKGLTPLSELPKHYGHDVKGVAVVDAFCKRLRVPAKMTTRLKHVTRFHMNMHKLDQLNSKTYIKMFEQMDAFRDPEVVDLLWTLGIFDERGRLGHEYAPVEHLGILAEAFEAAESVKFADVFPDGETKHTKIKDGMFRARVKAVAARRDELEK